MKTVWSYLVTCLVQATILFVATPGLRGEEGSGEYVSRKEYEELKAELLSMKQELDSLKKSRHSEAKHDSAKADVAAAAPASPAADSDKSVVPPTEPPKESLLGMTNFHIAGFGTATFEARNGDVSNFSATFNPIF